MIEGVAWRHHCEEVDTRDVCGAVKLSRSMQSRFPSFREKTFLKGLCSRLYQNVCPTQIPLKNNTIVENSVLETCMWTVFQWFILKKLKKQLDNTIHIGFPSWIFPGISKQAPSQSSDRQKQSKWRHHQIAKRFKSITQ